MSFNSTDFANGATIIAGTRLRVAAAGTYDIQFSAVFQHSGSAVVDVELWFRINGNDVPWTNTIFAVEKNAPSVEAWNVMFQLNAGDYVELVWHSAEPTMQVRAVGPQVGPPVRPAVPSIILTIDRVG